MRTRFDVSPSEGKWELRRNDHRLNTFDRQDDAIKAGREEAKAAQPSQLVVHGTDGKIRDEWTYQDDPYPPAG
jgi:hypothetical protein